MKPFNDKIESFMDTFLAILIFLAYLAFFCLYIFLFILFVRLSKHVEEIKDAIKGISYRDTARYIGEVQNGTITDRAQHEAEENFTNPA